MTNPPSGGGCSGELPDGGQIVPRGIPWKKRAGFILRIVISAVLVGLVVRRLDWSVVEAILRRADGRLLCIASGLTIVPVFLLSVRWYLFVRQQGIVVSEKNIFFLTWAGQFFNAVLPGSTGGDFVKIFQLCLIAPDRKAGAVASVVADRLTALAALLLLAVVALVRQPMSLAGGLHIPPWLATVVAALAVAGVGAGGLLWSRRPALFAKFLSSMKLALRPGFPLFAGLFLSLAIHLFAFFLFFLFSRSMGFPISYGETLVFLPVLLVAMLVPVTVNGHGLRELVLIYYFHALGLFQASGSGSHAAEFVVSLSLVMVANELLWSLPGGILYVIRYRGMR